MKKSIVGIIICLTPFLGAAQKKGTDSVVVDLAKTSRLVFTIRDKSDLEQLKQYDYQALFNDMLMKLENNDSVIVIVDPVKNVVVLSENDEEWARKNDEYKNNEEDDDNDDDDDYDYHWNHWGDDNKHHRTTQSFNVDFGINNYLENGKFPDQQGEIYAVRPWGSWNIALNSVQRTRLDKKFFIEWAVGVSWYNFKFEDDNTTITRGDDGVIFDKDIRDVSFEKSKLSVSYVNASIIPMFDIGGNSRKNRMWRSYNSTFRIGAGPYVGYRIGSFSKLVYEEDGDKEKDRANDNFYLNNVRYGVRLQIGVRSADFFFNYDLNELFAAGKGPELNAFSFGVTF